MNSFSIARYNARGILAPVLDYGQGVIDRLISVRVPDDADHAAHQPCLVPKSDISIFPHRSVVTVTAYSAIAEIPHHR